MAGINLQQLRKKRGYTQEYMAGVIGVSRPTYIQIEKGERELTVSEAQKLAALFGVSLDGFLKGEAPLEPKVILDKAKPKAHPEGAGIRVPADKVRKFKEVLLYILGKVGAQPNIGQTALYKILYFIDFDYFENYGKKLIGATYIKNKFGPTPVEFKSLIEEMEKEKSIETVKSRYFQFEQRKYLPLANPDLNLISGAEMDFIDKQLARLAGKNARELSDFSHGDAPWKITEDGKKIDYDLVFEREAPYTNHNYLQEWADAGALDMLKELGPMSKEEYDYYMNLPDYV